MNKSIVTKRMQSLMDCIDALYNEEGGSIFIYRSTLSNNSAHQGGGLLDDGKIPQFGSVVVEDCV